MIVYFLLKFTFKDYIFDTAKNSILGTLYHMTAIQIDRSLNNIKSYKMCMLLQLTTWLKKIYLQKWMFQSSDDCCMSWCQDVKLYLTLMWLVLVIHGCFFGYLFRKKDKHKKWWKLNLIIRNSWHLRKDVLHSKFHEISNKDIKKKPKKLCSDGIKIL